MDNSARTSISQLPITSLKPYPNNAKKHPKKQLKELAESINSFGFLVPINIDENNVILSGHGRWMAAKMIGLDDVLCLRHEGLTEDQKRAYVLADNKIAERSKWDYSILKQELTQLKVPDLDLVSYPTGFSLPEINRILKKDDSGSIRHDEIKHAHDAQNVPFPILKIADRCKYGDIWQIGPHRLICGDPSDPIIMKSLMGDNCASMVISVPTMPDADLEHDDHHHALEINNSTYLQRVFDNSVSLSSKGSYHFVFADWTDMEVVLKAGAQSYEALSDLIIWNKKSDRDEGGLYHSGHTLIFAFRNGLSDPSKAKFPNSKKSNRSNVWHYESLRHPSIHLNDDEFLNDIRPINLLIDAIKDTSHEGDIILDPFGWLGSTLIAAHKTDRKCYLCEEYLPFCNFILARAESATGSEAQCIKRAEEHDAKAKGYSI